jgi:hypothetical protein
MSKQVYVQTDGFIRGNASKRKTKRSADWFRVKLFPPGKGNPKEPDKSRSPHPSGEGLK